MSREYQKKEILKAFDEFIKAELPVGSDLVEYREEQVVLKIFMYTPPKKTNLIASLDAKEDATFGIRPYPIGRVIGVGAKAAEKYKAGDFVRLRDSEAAFIVNPAYDAWTKVYEKGNMQKVGETPPKFISNFGRAFSNSRYTIDPFDADDEIVHDTYIVDQISVLGKIKDIRTFAKYINRG